MILALDIGNSQIFCGVFDGDQLKCRCATLPRHKFLQTNLVFFSAERLGENNINPESIEIIGISSYRTRTKLRIESLLSKIFQH